MIGETEPVHVVSYAGGETLMAPCGAQTTRYFWEEMDPRCPAEPTCPACIAWKAAHPKEAQP